jgi:hypothetical protein
LGIDKLITTSRQRKQSTFAFLPGSPVVFNNFFFSLGKLTQLAITNGRVSGLGTFFETKKERELKSVQWTVSTLILLLPFSPFLFTLFTANKLPQLLSGSENMFAVVMEEKFFNFFLLLLMVWGIFALSVLFGLRRVFLDFQRDAPKQMLEQVKFCCRFVVALSNSCSLLYTFDCVFAFASTSVGVVVVIRCECVCSAIANKTKFSTQNF